MAELQAWFAPLLWIIGTFTAIIAFIRLCKPIWRVFTASSEFSKQLTEVNESMNRQFQEVGKRLGQQDIEIKALSARLNATGNVQMSLLHDQIADIYQQAQKDGKISQENYRRAKDLHAMDGTNPYIDGLIESLDEMFAKGGS